MVYRLINHADVGRTREEFVNHEPQASDLRILRVFYQHPKWFSAYKPEKLVVYCFYIIIQKTRDFSMGLPAQ